MKKYWIMAVLAGVLTACQESLEDRCEREARTYTAKNCPLRLDDNTTLDSMTFERATHTIHYYYRLTGAADRDSILEDIDAGSALKNELKNATSLRTYKDSKYRFAYTFHSSKDPGKVLYEVVFTDKDY